VLTCILKSINNAVVRTLCKQNALPEYQATGVFNGASVTVLAASYYLTASGIEQRYTIRLVSGIEFDGVKARNLEGIERFEFAK